MKSGKKGKRKNKIDKKILDGDISSQNRKILNKSKKEETEENKGTKTEDIQVYNNENNNDLQSPAIYANQTAPAKKKITIKKIVKKLVKKKKKKDEVVQEKGDEEINTEQEKLPFEGKELQCPFCSEIIITEVKKKFVFSSCCSSISFFICLLLATFISRGNNSNDPCFFCDEPCGTCSCCHEFIHSCPKCKKVIGTRPPTSMCCF